MHWCEHWKTVASGSLRQIYAHHYWVETHNYLHEMDMQEQERLKCFISILKYTFQYFHNMWACLSRNSINFKLWNLNWGFPIMTHNMFSHSKTAPSLNRTKHKELKKYKYTFFLFTSRFSERIIALKHSTTNPPVRAYDDAKSSNTKQFKNTEKYRKHKKTKYCMYVHVNGRVWWSPRQGIWYARPQYGLRHYPALSWDTPTCPHTIIAQCKYESKYEYKFKYIPKYRSTNKYRYN